MKKKEKEKKRRKKQRKDVIDFRKLATLSTKARCHALSPDLACPNGAPCIP